MAAKAKKPRTTKKQAARVDAYQLVTDRIIDALEHGVVPWKKPWRADLDAPRSLSSRKPYRGVNVFLLLWTAAAKGYASPWWGTYRQITDRGGQVRKGEHGSVVVFWRVFEVEDAAAKGGKRKIPMLRYFTVFNADQCDELDVPKLAPEADFVPLKKAEAALKRYLADGGPTFKHGGSRAFYNPPADSLATPKPGLFDSREAYYSTLWHEVTHSTGHASRLNRDGITDPVKFGTEKYGKEELIAEMGAAFLCGETGIPPLVDESAAYIQHWLTTIKGDPKLVVQAAGAAQKAANLVLGITYDADAESGNGNGKEA